MNNITDEAADIIQDLLDAIPRQDNDHDWWPDDLTHAVEKANKFIDSLSPNAEIEKLKSEVEVYKSLYADIFSRYSKLVNEVKG